MYFSPAVLKPASTVRADSRYSSKNSCSAVGVGLASSVGMPNLRLVKTTEKRHDMPRRGRGSSVSTERRYRYPSDEIWQVSEERWQVAESRPPSPKAFDGFGEAGCDTLGTPTR